jgi:CBS domain containing-hemolysin-like protein
VFLTLQATAAIPTGPAGDLLLRAGIAVGLVLVTAFFTAAEAALGAARRARIEAMAHGGNRRARLADRAIQRLEHYTAGARAGVILATLGLGWIGVRLVAALLDRGLRGLRLPLDPVAVWATAAVVAFILVAWLHVVLGQLVPRLLARLNPEGVALWSVAPLMLLTRVLSPFTAAVHGSARAVLSAFGLKPPDEGEPVHRPEELEELLTRTYEHGLLSEEPVEMIRGVFGLSDTTAAEVMTPRTSVVALQADTTVAAAASFILEEGHSRYPVYEETIDRIAGVVLARDVWRAQVQGVTDLRAIMRPPLYVPDTKPVEHLLREMRRERAHLAVVIDEFGGTEGIVTIEDVVEEIVGEIEDELDEEEAELELGPDGEVLMSGGFTITELNERYELELPDEDYTTVGGFVLGRLGRVAQVGDTVEIRGGTLRVLEMSARRVGRLALHLEPPPPETPDEAEEWE